MHFDDRDECVREMEEEVDRCVTHTHARTEAGLMGKSEEERGRERMTLNRLGIGSGGRRSGNKREAKREKGGGGGGMGWRRWCVVVVGGCGC